MGRSQSRGTVSGVIMVTGVASSAVGVREVHHLQIDGKDVAPVYYPSPLVQLAPFTFQRDSKAVADGAHNIDIPMNDLPGSASSYGFSQFYVNN